MLPSGLVASQRLAQPKAPNSVARKNIWPTSGDVTPFAGRSPAEPPQDCRLVVGSSGGMACKGS